MDTKLMNSENSKISDPHRLLLNISDKINLMRSDKYVALSNLNIQYTLKKVVKNNTSKRSAPTWNKKLQLPGKSYSVSDSRLFYVYYQKP